MTSPDRPVPPLTPNDEAWIASLRKIAANAQDSYVGRHWPDMTGMRRDGIGFNLNDGEKALAIRRFLYEFQPEFVLHLLDLLDAARAKPTPEPPTGILPGMMFGTGGNDLSAAIPQPTPALDVDVLRDAIKSLGNRYPILSSDPVLGDEPDSSGNHELLELGHETWWEHGRLADAIAAQYTRLAALREAE